MRMLRWAMVAAIALVCPPAMAQVGTGTSPLSIAKGGTAASTAAGARTNLGLVPGTDVQAWDANLDCLAALSTGGLVARTGAGTCAVRTVTAPAAGLTISNGDGVSGNPTLALADDLAAIEALTGTGIMRRTGSNAWSLGTAVTNSELATMATGTLKGNVSGSTATPSDLTATQVTAALNAVVGDSGTGGTKGLVPAPGAGDYAGGKYLDAGGNWSVPAGGGGGGGLSDTDRRNALLDRIYQSKLLGTARRGINTWTTGFKGASDAANGINTAASSNYLVNPADGYAAPTAAAGSRIASGITPTAPHGGTAANANDNNTGTTLTTSAWSSTAGITDPNSRIVVKFDLGADTSIAKLEAIGASISQYTGFIQFYYSTAAQGGGSNAWTKYGSDMPVSTTPADFSTTSAIMARYVAIMISQDTYNGSQTIGVQDFNVYAAAHNDMTLVTAAQTTDSSVGNARALLEYDNAASPALNTDLTVEVTCDGGANWASATLSAVTAYSQGGRKVVETADTACTAGASFAARIKTFNSKNVMVYGAAVTVH